MAWLMVGGSLEPVWAEVKVDRLFPAAVAVGQTQLITAEGSFANWPAEVWCDRADVAVAAAEESGKWNVTIAPDAAAGVAWLRFFDGDSASTLLPLLIENVPVVAEVEPNQSPATATAVSLPGAVVGRLDKNGEVDCFVVTAAAGQVLVASLMANRILDAPMDGVLQITDLAGNVLAQNDDARGYDPQIAFPVPADGQYVVRLFAFPTDPNSTIGFSGAASYVYRLLLTTGPMLNHALPLVAVGSGAASSGSAATMPADIRAEGNLADIRAETMPADIRAEGNLADIRPVGWNLAADLPLRVATATAVSPPIVSSPQAVGWELQPELTAVAAAATAVDLTAAEVLTAEVAQLPALISARLLGPDSKIKVHLTATSGQPYRTIVYSQSSNLKVDSVITVTDRDSGKQLAKNDDQPAALRDAAIDFAATSESGNVNVEVQVDDLVGGFGPVHDLTLAIYPRQPSVRLAIDATEFKLTAGGTLEIPVKINRLDGFDQPLQISVEQLPATISAAVVPSVAAEDSGKQVTVKLEASAELPTGHQTFRIVARSAGDGDQPILATALADVRKRFSLSDLWLTTIAAAAEPAAAAP